MAERVDGCTLHLPAALDVKKVRVETQQMPGLGFMDAIKVPDPHTITFAFVATTEAGELLARRMREGKCWMEAIVPRDTFSGVTLRQLRIRIVWAEASEDERIIRGAIES